MNIAVAARWPGLLTLLALISLAPAAWGQVVEPPRSLTPLQTEPTDRWGTPLGSQVPFPVERPTVAFRQPAVEELPDLAPLEITPADPPLLDGPVLGEPQIDLSPTPELGQAIRSPEEAWTWQVLPEGILYQSYLAGGREPRTQGVWHEDQERGWVWDIALGGRAAILRYGNSDPIYPEGWQLEIEGVAFPRLSMEFNRDVDASDYRFGVPLARRVGPWETKLAFYHISSHVGDEYFDKFPDFQRNNYSRDVLVLGSAYRFNRDLRIYGEVGWAFYTTGPSEPWEVQFGIEYCQQSPTGIYGTPYVAANCRLREEVDWGGNVILQVGWAWVGWHGRKFRIGASYFNGHTDQVIFIGDTEQMWGGGLYYDF